MSDQDGSGKRGDDGGIVRFPHSRVRPTRSGEPANNLGPSLLVRKFGPPGRQETGHWCSKCKGIWFGYPLEVACPVCGNRHG